MFVFPLWATPIIALLVLLFGGGSFGSRAASAGGWLVIGAAFLAFYVIRDRGLRDTWLDLMDWREDRRTIQDSKRREAAYRAKPGPERPAPRYGPRR